MDLFAQDALDLLGDLRRIDSRPDGYADQGAPRVSEAGSSALHAADLVQSRQHGREPLRSATSGLRQGWPGKTIDQLLAVAPAAAKVLLATARATITARAHYMGQAAFRKAGHQEERAEPASLHVWEEITFMEHLAILAQEVVDPYSPILPRTRGKASRKICIWTAKGYRRQPL